MMKRLTCLAAVLAALAFGAPEASAQWKPDRPIQLIVGFQAGGGTDVTARLVAQAAEGIIPVPVIVVNRPGAAGAIAAEMVARGEADGYTLLIGGGSESTTLPHYNRLNYTLGDFRGVARVNREHMVLVTRRGGGLDTVEKLVAAAKAEPGKISYGSSGMGGILHATFQAFEKAAGIQMNHVAYRGGAHALGDVLGGRLDMTLVTPAEAKGQADAGNVHILATTSNRSAILPEVPSLRELGYAVNIENMKGLMVSARTPDPIIRALDDLFRQVIESQRMRELAERTNVEVAYLDGADFKKAMDDTSQSVLAARRD